MEFIDFKTGQTYFAISDGQYMGAFHILGKNEKVMKTLIAYYGGEVRVEIVEEVDLENDDDYGWLVDSFTIGLKPNNDKIRESLHEMIEAIFTRRNVVLKIIRGRR